MQESISHYTAFQRLRLKSHRSPIKNKDGLQVQQRGFGEFGHELFTNFSHNVEGQAWCASSCLWPRQVMPSLAINACFHANLIFNK